MCCVLRLEIHVPDPPRFFAVDLDDVMGDIGGKIGLGLQVWVEISNIVLSKLDIGDLKIMPDYKADDDSFTQLDIQAEKVGLQANLDYKYFLCKCYAGMKCEDDLRYGSDKCSEENGFSRDLKKGCCAYNPDSTDRKYTKKDCQVFCKRDDPKTWNGIEPGSGSGEGHSTNSAGFQRLRFHPKREVQLIEFPSKVPKYADYANGQPPTFKLEFGTPHGFYTDEQKKTQEINFAENQYRCRVEKKPKFKRPKTVEEIEEEYTPQDLCLNQTISNALNKLISIKPGYVEVERIKHTNIYRVEFFSGGDLLHTDDEHPVQLLKLVDTTVVADIKRNVTYGKVSRSPIMNSTAEICPEEVRTDDDACYSVIIDDLHYTGGKTSTVARALDKVTQDKITDILGDLVATTVLENIVMKRAVSKLISKVTDDINQSLFNPWLQSKSEENAYNPMRAQAPMLDLLANLGGFNREEKPRHKAQLFNYTDPENVWMNRGKQFIESVINYKPDKHGNPPHDPLRPSDIRLNRLINSIADNDEGRIDFQDVNIKIMEGSDQLTKHYLEFTHMYLGHLNTFTLADIINPIGDFTLSNVLKLQKLSIEFDCTLHMWPSEHDEKWAKSHNSLVEEKFRLSLLNLENVEIDVKALAALDTYLATALRAGSIWSDPIGCLPLGFHELNITSMIISAGSISAPNVAHGENGEDFLDSGTTYMLNQASKFIHSSYSELLLWLFPTISQTTIRDTIQGGTLKKRLGEARQGKGRCNDPGPQEPLHIDFQTEELVVSALDWINNTFTSNVTRLNEEIRGATDGGSMELLDAMNFSNVVKLGPKSQLGIELDLFKVAFHNLDTIGDNHLLFPLEPYVLRNYIEMANPNRYPEVYFEAHMNLTLAKNPCCTEVDRPPFSDIRHCRCKEGWDRANFIQNDFVTKLSLRQMQALLQVNFKANKQRVKSLRLRELLEPNCYMGTLDDTSIIDLLIGADEFSVDIDCKYCQSSAMKQAEKNADTAAAKNAMSDIFNSAMRNLTRNLLGEESAQALLKRAHEGELVCNCKTNPDVTIKGPALNMTDQKQYKSSDACIKDVTAKHVDPDHNGAELEFPTELMIAVACVVAFLFWRLIIWPPTRLLIDFSDGSSRKQWFHKKEEKLLEKQKQFDMFKADKG